jgi:hypothetical protein
VARAYDAIGVKFGNARSTTPADIFADKRFEHERIK